MAIKIVPIHPRISGVAPLPTSGLAYQGGALLQNVKVFVVYWGDHWSQALSQLAQNLDVFFTTIVTSSLIDQLSEYSVPSYAIGHGTFIGSVKIPSGSLGAQVTDAQIQAQLQSMIVSGAVPTPDANTLVFFFLQDGVSVISGADASCTQFCGYHDATPDPYYYAVMPYPGCAGCVEQGMSVLEALTGTSSHELCEAITDPVPGAGWIDIASGGAEIGDLCAWTFKSVDGYNVQLEWSNKQNACV